MAPTKQKRSVSKSRRSSEGMAQPKPPAAKKQKTAHEQGARNSLDKKEARRPPNVEGAGTAKAAVSILREEEPLFPRGGGSVLTPLEQRQIKAEAERDVLFEQAGKGKKRRAPEDDGADDDDGDGEAADGLAGGVGSSVASRRPGKAIVGRKKAKKNVEQPSKDDEVQEPTTKIEGLNYHRLVPGSLVLGQVVQIFKYDLVLSLPNNLIGFVPISAVSDQFTERVKAFARSLEDDASWDREQSPDDADSNSLESVCSLGQYLRACVTAINDKSAVKGSAKGRHRIELSINPRMANIGLSKSDLAPNVVVQASVISVEDHGLVMDVGTADGSVKGFVPTGELHTDVDITKVRPGYVFLCIVTSRSSNGKVVKLSTVLHRPKSGKKNGVLSDAPTIDAFLPGTAVEMAISDVSPHGVTGKLMNAVDATADLFHAGANFENEYKVGQKVRGRVICTFPKVEPKKVGISLLNHVRILSALKVNKDGTLTNPHEAMPNLTIVEDATVVRVVPNVGLWLNLGYEAVLGFAHISVVSDKRIESLSETDGPYKIGSKHRARLTGYNAVDGLYIVSLQKSVLKKVFMRYSDIEVGQVVKGKVEKLITNENGISALLISLAADISGLVTGLHLSDVRLSHPEKKFHVGTPVTARVLTVDPAKKKMQLTLKRSLVQSELPLLTTSEPKMDDSRYLGTLMKVTTSGATLHFYNGVKGYLPGGEMSYAQIKNPQEHFHAGQVVNIRVIKVDKRRHRVIVSCKDATAAPDDTSADVNGESVKKEKSKKKAKSSTRTAEEAGETGLKTVGFDWTADVLDAGRDNATSDGPADEQQDDDDGRSGKKKKRHKAAAMQVDRTGDLDAHGPQSVSDFERLLLGEPDSSYLWLQYMAFQLQLGEVAKARSIAERALATIDMTEVAEKLNVWIALLNLENTYGTDESLDSVFKRACQYNDPQDVHERLISIYIQLEKLDKADALFQVAVKKFSQSPALWLNYATFLMTSRGEPDAARALLARATQALPPRQHVDLTAKFAQLEFRSPHGNAERGRTFFEALLAAWPKRLDLWSVLLDLEMSHGSGGGGDSKGEGGQPERVRALFERVIGSGRVKPHKAAWFFKRWIAFEEQQAAKGASGAGEDSRRVQNVKARAAQYDAEYNKAKQAR